LSSGDERAAIEADWPLFNDKLAFASAVFAYYHLLPHRRIMVRPLSDGTPSYEVSAVGALYPAFSGLLRLLLGLTAARAKSALEDARNVLAEVDKRLADGRRYLVGDRFSLSDMAFAVAAAPLVLPEGYAERLPPLRDMPDVLQRAVAETRGRPAGQLAMRIYRDHRNQLSDAQRSDRGGRDELSRSLGG
jgi:glutathione S-transferase